MGVSRVGIKRHSGKGATRMAEVRAGLQDVVVATSQICSIAGQRGKLSYWGYDIHDLAANSTFEEVVYLLWHGRLPKRAELEELRQQLTENRPVSPEIVELLKRSSSSSARFGRRPCQ